jgi:colicin import membrane protein
MNYLKKHKKGLIGSTIFHLIVLVLLIWLGFFTPFPLPGEEGILVNFGTGDQGLGKTETSLARHTPPVVREERKTEESPPRETPPPQPASEPEPTSSPPAAENEAMTQDYEETVAIDAAEKKREEEERIKKENEEKERRKKEAEELEKQRQEKLEKQRQEELERQRQEELERQRLEELERQRLEELERQRREEEERKINEINTRTRNAFEHSGSGGGETGSDEGDSQGVTYPGGNQGVLTGSPNSSQYGEGGSGSGTQGSGISYSLSGRTSLNLPEPEYPGNEEGTVVVRITVDKKGNVTKADAGVSGSNTLNLQLLEAAKRAALQARFNIDNNAPAFQTGTITYRFSLSAGSRP